MTPGDDDRRPRGWWQSWFLTVVALIGASIVLYLLLTLWWLSKR
jgi:hypothetical protein